MTLEKYFKKWCVWRFDESRPGSKPGKVPVNPRTGGQAAKDSIDTFGTHAEAESALASGNYQGLGVHMGSADSIVCVDIDSCVAEDGTPNSIAAWALSNFEGTYCEVSQSGRGLHFFVRAIKPSNCRTKVTRETSSLEIYDRDGNYICVTGKSLHGDSCGEVIDAQPALDRFIQHFSFLREDTPAATPHVSGDLDTDDEPHTDEVILKLLRTRNKQGRITRLLKGELRDYNGDRSAADAGLVAELVYYSNDPEQVERIFGTSGLVRDKWTERRDYRERTIQKAFDSRNKYFWDEEKRKAHDRASGATRATAQAEKLTGGLEGLRLSKQGNILATVDNATQVLLRDHRTMGTVGFNTFSGAPVVLRPLRDVFGPGASNVVGDFVEHDVTALRAWLGREWGMALSKNDAYDVFLFWARHGEFNPVTRRLDECAANWDGEQRIDTWLQRYLGADIGSIGEYLRSIGRGWLVGAVARAFVPGSKVDAALILEGAQGAGKSRAARVLAEAVCAETFIEALPSLSSSEQTALALRGAWIVELSELACLQGRVESEQVKSFLSAQTDLLREPYSRRHVIWKRTAVFIGSTNQSEYLRDDTGGRRFWGVKVGTIDLDSLQRDAPQLWAEAVLAYRSGEPWHIQNVQALQQASEQQHERLLTDSWDDPIAEFARSEAEGPDARITSWAGHELFTAVFKGQDLHEKPQIEQRRFSAALRRCGYGNRKAHGNMRWRLTDEKWRELHSQRND